MATRVKREKKFFRNCPVCDKQIGHVLAAYRDDAAKKNKTCKSCGAKKRGPNNTCVYNDLYGEKLKYKGAEFIKLVNWGKEVRERTGECKKCKAKKTTPRSLHAHHILPKEYFPDTRLDLNNGVCLCHVCHRLLHADLDRITLAGIKLTQVGFQEHAENFIAYGNEFKQSTDVPPGYTSVFNPSVTITTE